MVISIAYYRDRNGTVYEDGVEPDVFVEFDESCTFENDEIIKLSKQCLGRSNICIDLKEIYQRSWIFLLDVFKENNVKSCFMKNVSVTLLGIIIFILGCHSPKNQGDMEMWKAEIVAVEKAFNDMAAEKGIASAFEYYAADEGVIMRNMEIISGKKAIAAFTSKAMGPNQSLTWSPTFVDVSTSGDLAYTYGDFTFTYADSIGNKNESKGIFHTVWKRQEDGSWRFVWD